MFQAEAELDALIASVRNTTIHPDAFGHAAHVALAACICIEHGEQALSVMRGLLQALLDAFGVEQTQDAGYHETLTAAWLALVAHHLQRHAGPSRLDRVNAVVEELLDKRLLLKHYSRDLIMSPLARHQYVPPDRAALPGTATDS